MFLRYLCRGGLHKSVERGTLPEARSEGIGRRIVEYLISDAKERGTEKIYLESSGVAKELYHEIGFADMEDYMKLGDKQ